MCKLQKQQNNIKKVLDNPLDNGKKIRTKSVKIWFCISGCGGRTRTFDLRVMSPTSYQLLHPAILTLQTGSTALCLYIIALFFDLSREKLNLT